MRRAIVAAGLGALALSGCAAPDVRPVAEARAPAQLGLAGPATPAIDAEWWRAWRDPQLDRLVADALAGSPTLEQAIARVRRAEAQLSGAEAERRPDVSGVGIVNATRSSKRFIGGGAGGSDAIRTIGILGPNLSWNLDLFGRQAAAIRQAGRAADAAALDLAAAKVALAGSVVQAYVQLTAAEAQVGIANESIATRRRSVRLTDAAFRNQLGNRLQVEAAATLLAQAREAAVAAGRSRALAANALAELAGRGPDYAAAIGPSRLGFADVAALPGTVPADLLGRRPDIAAARARIEAATAGRQVARRAYYPNVNLIAFAGLQAIGLGNLFSLDAATVAAGPAVSLPIFDGGRLRANLETATADVDLATADYNARVVGAVRDAADAITQIRSLDAQRVRSREVVRGFSETVRLNGIRVASGLESQLNTLDTDIRLLDARLSDTNLAAAQANQRVQLVVALGGGFAAVGQQDPIR